MTLPEGWAEATIGDIAVVDMGQSPSGEYTNSEGVGLPLIGGAADIDARGLKPNRYTSAPTKIAQSGDIVLCVRATIGRLAVADRQVCLGRGVAGLRPLVDHLWFIWLLRESAEALDQAGVGSTFRQIDSGTLNRWPIGVPPAAEQRRIALKLDALTARIARAKADLDRVPVLASRLRATALKQTFQRSDLHGVELRQVLSDVRYGTAKKCDYGTGKTPVLRIPNVQGGRVDLSDLKSANFDASEISKLALEIGDVLVIRSNGSLNLVGKSAVVDVSSVGLLYAGYLIRLRPNREKVLPEYLNYFLGSPQTRQTIENAARSTSGVNNVNAQQLQALTIPLPSVAEQYLCVRALDAAFTRAARLEAEAARARGLLDRLESAILAQAFRGELVSQDPNDEPASLLLERVRTQRAAAPKPKRGRGVDKARVKAGDKPHSP